MHLLNRIGMLLVLSLVLVATPAPAAPVMVGYFPAFKGIETGLATTAIGHYTHINIAFANPDASGALAKGGVMTCMSGGKNDAVTVAELRETVVRLRAGGAKVLLSVAGGSIPGCSGDWATLLGSDARATVLTELISIVDAAGLDGIDIDIEGELLTAIDRQGNYTPFIAALSKALKRKGKLLTVATASYEGGMIPVGSVRYFDLVMPMSYDMIGPSWGQPGAEHSTYAQAERDVALWLARGVRPERLVLGVPFYGYGFGTLKPGGGFNALFATHGDAALTSDIIGRACAGCDYVTFNSPATLKRKAELARSRAGGIMVWEITQDTTDQILARTISTALYAAPAN